MDNRQMVDNYNKLLQCAKPNSNIEIDYDIFDAEHKMYKKGIFCAVISGIDISLIEKEISIYFSFKIIKLLSNEGECITFTFIGDGKDDIREMGLLDTYYTHLNIVKIDNNIWK